MEVYDKIEKKIKKSKKKEKYVEKNEDENLEKNYDTDEAYKRMRKKRKSSEKLNESSTNVCDEKNNNSGISLDHSIHSKNSETDILDENTGVKRKKLKKKKHAQEEIESDHSLNIQSEETCNVSMSKKRKKENNVDPDICVVKKKKKYNNSPINGETETVDNCDTNILLEDSKVASSEPPLETKVQSVSAKNKKKKKRNKRSRVENIVAKTNIDEANAIPKKKKPYNWSPPWLKSYGKNGESFYGEYLPCNPCGRLYTSSIAIPASILEETCLLDDLRTYVSGQIARALCIYGIDEIIIYDDHCWKNKGRYDGDTSELIEMMKMVLEYQECPQYLRKDFFPFHHNLRNVGVLNALNAPHHLLSYQWCMYREGVVRDRTAGNCSYVDVGLKNEVKIDKKLKAGLRVTIKFPPETEEMKSPYGFVVSPEEPRTVGGLYWGFTVRVANSLSEVFQSDRFNKYDLIIGTSDKGSDASKVKLPHYNHALIVFGGVKGLETAFERDSKLSSDTPSNFFRYYLNTCPAQQSRTVRTEEAILITLSNLSPKLRSVGLSS